MTLGALLLLAAAVAVQGIDPRVPPKFIRAAQGLQKALYAEKFGYSLVPLPNNILAHLNKSKSASPTSRAGRSRKSYRPRSRRRRPRRPKRPVKHRRPNGYGLPTYAKRYKHYVPQRRPHRYKKRNRFRGPHRGYRDPSDFEYYEQDISDYEDYGPGEYDYEYDREFINRHAELYNGGYDPGIPRGKVRGEKSRPQYYPEEEERFEEFRIPLAPKRERDKPTWMSSGRRPFSAAVAGPSRTVTLREPSNHKTFNWDPKSSSYKVISSNKKRPQSYVEHYVEEYENGQGYGESRETASFLDYNKRTDSDSGEGYNKRMDSRETQLRNRDEDIGFGQGMETVDGRFTGWTV